ncbi:hypothetical protein FIBSPDRAFT_177967 [Athelia psychrophila]|uniref:DUF6534 domain-containing protein n=1 Tax=Athelia psychrophila TaxID=1759441 RepID=A0A166SPE3_9AGAM|nr:hypothetical protein FIBSPDRAFT_177967 [Fibularhizoctonia sp. CBS 109695]
MSDPGLFTGSGFVGFAISLSLCGVSIAQAIFYYRAFPHDGRTKKLIVLLVTIADIAHTTVVGHMFSEVLVHSRLLGVDTSTFPATSVSTPWQIQVSFTLLAFTVAFVQGFLCLRVWRVSRNNVVLVFIIIASALTTFGVLIYCAVDPTPQDVKFNPATYPIARVPFAAALVCDGTIAASLTYYFNSYRTGMPRTEPVIQQLIWLSMSTGVMVCLMEVVAWTLFELDSEHRSVLAPLFIVGKLYVNTMMANLNSRRHFRTVVDRSMDLSFNNVFDTKLATD